MAALFKGHLNLVSSILRFDSPQKFFQLGAIFHLLGEVHFERGERFISTQQVKVLQAVGLRSDPPQQLCNADRIH